MAPPVLKLKFITKFPANVLPSGFITISKSGLTYTFGADFSILGESSAPDAPLIFVAQDIDTGGFVKVSLASLRGQPVRVVTAAGAIDVTSQDVIIGVRKDTPAATIVNLLPAANASPLTVKDLAGNAAANNITLTPNGSETIDGQASFVIDSNFAALTVRPLPDGSGYFIT